MYEAPVLVQYGTFRELTLHHPTTNAKRPLVNDLATVFGPGGNTGCNTHAQWFSHAGCMST